MFNVGWTEMLVIGIVLILVVGPKDLPGLLRTFGRTMTQLRSMAGEFRNQFDEALKEAELDDVRKTFSDAKKLNPARELREAMNPLRKAGEDLKSDIDRTMRGSAKSDETIAKKDPAAPASGDTKSPGEAGTAAKAASGPAAGSPASSVSSSANGGTAPAAAAATAPKSAEPLKAGAVTPVTKDTTSKPAAKKKAAGRTRKVGAGSSTTKTTARKAAPKKTAAPKKAGDA